MTLRAGSQLGPYEIIGPLGSGGMGEVYRARDRRLGRDVAIKVLPAESSRNPDRLRRFEEEARAVAALSHPNVLAIFDVGTSDVPYLVTELLEGDTLRALLDRGPLGVQRTVELALQLVSGLSAAHLRGIVHRDLKPENIFILNGDHVKILDFGLARHVAPGDDAPTRAETIPGTLMGTLGYMAPEQARGDVADHRADIFTFGAIVFEMLTGQRAFRRSSSADTLSAILHEPPGSLVFGSGSPPALAALVRRCLAKDPAQRFQSARELAHALEAISHERSDIAVRPDVTSPTSIAVLPFANLSTSPENQYFSDGLAEDLINALARLSGLRVASRTSSFRFRGREMDVREIGRELGVGAILEGSVRRAGARLRINVQLTNADGGFHIWSERYDREMVDVFDIQDEIVQSVVSALAPALLGEARGAVHRPTENLQAYELYLKGRHFWNQRSPAVMGTAIRHFEDAIALDPGYALAYSGLADCYSILRVYGWTPLEYTQRRALDAVSKALALDPELPEAHFSKALYTFHFERHWREARRHFLDALALGPRSGTFEAYYGVFLASEFEYGEAGQRLARAIELEPHSSMVYFLAAAAACAMVEFGAAERYAARALEVQPESFAPRWPETISLLAAGRFEEAISAGERVVARTRAPIYIGVLGMVYGRAGRLSEARALLQELDEREGRGEYIVPVARLSIHLGLRDLAGVRTSLAACLDGGAAPFSVIATNRWLLEFRGDKEIDRMLDRLHDGARPPA